MADACGCGGAKSLEKSLKSLKGIDSLAGALGAIETGVDTCILIPSRAPVKRHVDGQPYAYPAIPPPLCSAPPPPLP